MLRLQVMEREILESPPLPALFGDACDLLTKRMSCTMARISLLDEGENHLISQACRTVRNMGKDLKETETIPLSLLPWHRMALDAKKLMLINQDDPESRMQPQESASTLLPEVKSAILVPIMVKDKVKGVISIGEARNWKRRAFGAADLIFAKDLAAKCSVALRLRQLESDAGQTPDQSAPGIFPANDRWSEVRMRLNSPLTSIIGAVELLKAKGTEDAFATRYHNLILRSADRIKTLAEEYSSPALRAEELEPEQVIG
jgi:transcriptional regulator with GAF, ATPase, and Fis domain